MNRFCAPLLILLTAVVIADDTWITVPGIIVQPHGGLSIGGLTVELVHYDATWRLTSPRQAVQARGRVAEGVWSLTGDWRMGETVAQLTQTLVLEGSDAVRLKAALAGKPPTNAFALVVTLEGALFRSGEIRIDGQPLILPVDSASTQVRTTAPATLVAVPLPTGGWLEVSGTLSVLVQDHRTWKSDSFSIRIVADSDLAIEAVLRLRPAAVVPLPLGAAAAIPLRDDVVGDGKGGWSDQGDNDLRALPADLVAAGLPFATTDRAMVLTDGRIANWPARAEVDAAGRQGACLYLLHAAAWAPRTEIVIGRMHLAYADGGNEEREVKSQRDVADWWNPAVSLPNARLGWAGDNPHASVGLYISRFPIPDRPLRSISFAAAGGAVWMVCGLALGEDVPPPAQPPDILDEDARWRPTAVGWEVEPGSALDLSAFNAGPVPGRLLSRGAHFVLESAPAKPVRLLGANLCFSANFPEHAIADRMAKGFRQLGYNSIRVHHFDGGLVKKGGDGTELDPEQLDRLEYLVAACKREGLWLTTDLYVSRTIPKGAIPELPDKEVRQEFKALIPLLPSAMDNWKRFATNLLTHRNPYTGLTWAEDPALATLSLVNEDNLPSWMNNDPDIKALFDARFEGFIASQPEAERSGPARDQARWQWLWRMQAAAYVTMREHVVALGVTAPTTGANMQNDLWTTALRDGFDFVDNHAYHDHPRFPQQKWRLPYGFHQRSAVAELLRVPTALAHTRRLDRPFTVSELNYCLPNHHRAEYAAGVPAVAGLQDWAGVWRFAFAGDIKQITGDPPADGFDLSRDPIAQLGDRAMALLYRRGDVAAAPWAVALGYRAEDAARWREVSPNHAYIALALHSRTGVLPASELAAGRWPADLRCVVELDQAGAVEASGLPVLPCDERLPQTLAASGLIKAEDFDLAKRRVRSADGQVVCDAAAGRLTVVGSRSVAAVLPGGDEAPVAVGAVTLVNRDRDPATVVVAALEAGGLDTSKRILVLHLTDAQNGKIRFADRKHTLVEHWGASPMLIRAGAVGVRLPGSGKMKAWALDLRGVRREAVALIPDGDGQRLEAEVVRPWGPCLAWEVVRE